MNEREELLAKFNKAMPLIEALDKNENESFKFSKTKDRLAKIIAFFTFIVVFAIIVSISFKWGFGGFIEGSFPFIVGLGIMIWLYTVNKKKIKKNEEEMVKILNSDELSFIPASYRCESYNMIGIYKVLLDMRADKFKEALNVWEQDKHNMVMEAKSAVIVK